MGKRGPKPKEKVKINWSSNFAYAIGLIVSDGNLSKNGRHINLTSKDFEQLQTFNYCLGIKEKICKKRSGSGNLAYYIQFSDVMFYKFLLEIGISPAKSKTIAMVYVPKKYFFDYLRGYFDGDGCSYSYYDPVFVKSYRFYISFSSGSEKYLLWLREKLSSYAGVMGHLNKTANHRNFQLKYSKREAEIISRKMYYHRRVVSLTRKRIKIFDSLT